MVMAVIAASPRSTPVPFEPDAYMPSVEAELMQPIENLGSKHRSRPKAFRDQDGGAFVAVDLASPKDRIKGNKFFLQIVREHHAAFILAAPASTAESKVSCDKWEYLCVVSGLL